MITPRLSHLLRLLLSGLTLMACSEPLFPQQRLEGQTMGTYYRIVHQCAPLTPASVDRELERVNAELSNYDPASELSRLNQQPLAEWLPSSASLPEILAAAQMLHSASRGAFDITVAPVLRLWGFGPGAEPIAAAPPSAELRVARERLDQQAVQWRSKPTPAVRRMADVEVDLSAIAKGYGVDRLAALLLSAGCKDFLVDIGGEVRAQGSGPSGRGWRIGVEVPDPAQFGAVQRVLELRQGGLATSGDYRNFVQLTGAGGVSKRRSHAIDPRTGAPVEHALASVTVVAESAMLADGWATTLLVLGPEEGWAVAQQAGLPALFLTRGTERFHERYTEALQPYLLPVPGATP